MRGGKRKLISGVPVTGYAAEGKSLARVDGKVYFIEGAVPGDVVDLLLTKDKKEWGEGKVSAFIQYSPDRVQPFCSHFGTCGGCKWQMLPYDKQLLYKNEEVIQHLHRIGKVELPPIRPIIGSDQTRFYRNKLEFTFSNRRYLTGAELDTWKKRNEEQEIPCEPALGFHVPGHFDKVIDIRECYLQPEPVNRIRNFVRQFSVLKGFSYYDIRSHAGWLRNLTIRIVTTGEVMVNLVFGHDDPSNRETLLNALLAEVPEITSLYYTINPKCNDSIHDLSPVLYHGSPAIIEQLGALRFLIGPKSFFQTNSYQAVRLYGVVRTLAGLAGTEVVYDLYCGTGSIGLFLSDLASRVIGVEVIPEAVQDARENARLNGIGHAQFFDGDVVQVCTDLFFRAYGQPDVIITDPPRAGMHEKLVRKILEINAPRVVYVSCNPATQARDLALLDERYRVTAVQPVDMFPHTHHIENVVQLTRRNV